MKKTLKRAGTYIRVSHLREDGVSPETQLEKAKLQADLQDLKIVKVYEDLDISGKSVNIRTGFKEMMDDEKLGFLRSCFRHTGIKVRSRDIFTVNLAPCSLNVSGKPRY